MRLLKVRERYYNLNELACFRVASLRSQEGKGDGKDKEFSYRIILNLQFKSDPMLNSAMGLEVALQEFNQHIDLFQFKCKEKDSEEKLREAKKVSASLLSMYLTDSVEISKNRDGKVIDIGEFINYLVGSPKVKELL